MGNRDKQNANLVQNRSREEAEALSRKGGINSGKTRRQYKTFRDILTDKLTDEMRFQLLEAMQKKALSGDTKAFEIIRDTIGEKPVDKVKNENVNVEIPLEEYLKKASDDNEY